MWLDCEYVDPYDVNDRNFWSKIEHFGRYIFAYDYLISKFSCTRSNVADVGCGNGYGTNILSFAADEIKGFDIDCNSLKTAKGKNFSKNIEYIQFDFNKDISKYQKEFNLIIAFEFLEHTDRPQVALGNLNTMLCEEGILLLSIPNEKFEKVDENGNPKNKYHKVIFSYEEIKLLINQEGFMILEEYGQYLPDYLLKIESKFSRKNRLPFSSLNNEDFLKKEYIEYFGRLLGYPNDIRIHDSYSYIFVLQKK